MSKDEVTTGERDEIAEWIAKGNSITVCPTGATTEGILPGYGWGRRPKKAVPEKAPAKKKAAPKKK
jgi:hypothetical protein|tara:strand:+ start:1157 stop:1354 length:198 start_codon:yes stop_codon:yes gene_type:complete